MAALQVVDELGEVLLRRGHEVVVGVAQVDGQHGLRGDDVGLRGGEGEVADGAA
jgi:hypothetical protein